MARRSLTMQRTPSSSSNKKRTAHNASTSTRSSKRLRSSGESPAAATIKPKKTAGPAKKDGEDDLQSTSSPGEPDVKQDVSGYEPEEASLASTPSASDQEDDYDAYDEDDIDSFKPKPQKSKPGDVKIANGKKSRMGSSGTGLGPGREVIVRLPKPRQAGGTPYEDHTLHPNTLLFLKDLAENNRREWLKMHDADFRTAEKDFDTFAAALTEKIIDRDDTIPELPVKDIKFRIYRDIRFSPDPTPYKPFFSAAWSRTGRKGPYACYYVQIQPGNSFVGGGIWQPDAGPLSLLRRAVDRKPHKLKRVLTAAAMRKEFFEGIPNDEERAVKAFVKHNQENMLKTKPKDFPSDHPDIELLRLRNYTVSKRVSDKDVLGHKGLERIASIIGSLTPLVTYLNGVVMPDAPSSGDDGASDDNSDYSDNDEDEDGGDDNEAH